MGKSGQKGGRDSSKGRRSVETRSNSEANHDTTTGATEITTIPKEEAIPTKTSTRKTTNPTRVGACTDGTEIPY